MRKAVVFGCVGPVLTSAERAVFAETRPWGFILFRRNVESPDQVRALVQALRDSVDDPDAPILIDQEGGRVQRLAPPHWPKYPPAAAYDAAVNDPLTARELVRLGARLMAEDLREVGVTIDCAPVIDTPVPGADDIIGDRAYGRDPATVGRLGRAAAEGLMAGGVLPVIKHMPGHGRAFADSHLALPVVETAIEDLNAWDFAPFRMLSDMPIAMTAHVVFTAIDKRRPATTSKKVIRLMRDQLGFGGLVVSDDLSMNALSGTLGQRASAAQKAGCDIVLHCNGVLTEMIDVAQAVGRLRGDAKRRADAALSRLVRTPEPLDAAEARARIETALAGRMQAARGPDVGEAQACA